jgi:hypothetical protein
MGSEVDSRRVGNTAKVRLTCQHRLENLFRTSRSIDNCRHGHFYFSTKQGRSRSNSNICPIMQCDESSFSCNNFARAPLHNLGLVRHTNNCYETNPKPPWEGKRQEQKST